jgi:hypothetical protein
MTENHTLIAFLSTLSAIVTLFGFACWMLYLGRSVEAIGIGGAITGLIGVLGTFRPQQRNVHVDNPPGDPVPVESQEPTP